MERENPSEKKLGNESGNEMIILSLDFHQDEEAVITETEIADYTEGEFLSDVGGTAGLVLGLSVASVLRYLQVLFLKACRVLISCLPVTIKMLLQKGRGKTQEASTSTTADYDIVKNI